MKNFATWWKRGILALAFGGALAGSAAAQVAPEKDYLSGYEADKIRDAETPNDKIKLFVQFADDRLKKFQYELEHPAQTNHTQMLNYLMNSYVGCVDDATDLMQEGVEKQQNVRVGIDLLANKSKEFLEILKKIQAEGKELEVYKE